jgi:hypothetical protein
MLAGARNSVEEFLWLGGVLGGEEMRGEGGDREGFYRRGDLGKGARVSKPRRDRTASRGAVLGRSSSPSFKVMLIGGAGLSAGERRRAAYRFG